MGKLLSVRDRVLLLLADIGDLVEEVSDPGGWMANYYQTLNGWIPERYKRSYFKDTVRRMLKVGDIEKIIQNGEPCLRITSRGEKKLVRDFPIILLTKKKWDGIGTLVIFDIKEIERGKREGFRHWLLALGAGQVQKSAYLFAYDLCCEIVEAVESFGLSGQVEVFPVTLEFVGDKKEFACRIWKLDRLEKAYEKILVQMKEVLTKKSKGREKLTGKIKGRFLEVLLSDPMLPEELLPGDWIGSKVRKLMKRL